MPVNQIEEFHMIPSYFQSLTSGFHVWERASYALKEIIFQARFVSFIRIYRMCRNLMAEIPYKADAGWN